QRRRGGERRGLAAAEEEALAPGDALGEADVPGRGRRHDRLHEGGAEGGVKRPGRGPAHRADDVEGVGVGHVDGAVARVAVEVGIDPVVDVVVLQQRDLPVQYRRGDGGVVGQVGHVELDDRPGQRVDQVGLEVEVGGVDAVEGAAAVGEDVAVGV